VRVDLIPTGFLSYFVCFGGPSEELDIVGHNMRKLAFAALSTGELACLQSSFDNKNCKTNPILRL
jgi:hypothetical protein